MGMTLSELIREQATNPSWKTGKVFICYNYDKICRMRERGIDISDGELFEVEDIDEDTLSTVVKPNQWWIEDGDLCVDFYRTW